MKTGRYRRRMVLYGALLLILISVAIPLLSMLWPTKTSAAAVSLLSGASETQETTSSLDYVATDTSISSGTLAPGQYLVIWGAAIANSLDSRQTQARLVRGSTELASIGSDSMAGVSADNGRSASGYWMGNLSGAEALRIEYKVDDTGSTGYIDSKYIKAMRVDDKLAINIDYFTTGPQESVSDELIDAPIGSWTTVKDLTKVFHDTLSKDYIVLASMEITVDSDSNDCQARIVVDGSSFMEQIQEGEDLVTDRDEYGYVHANVASIGSGTKSIALQGQSVGGATCDFRRSRIYVFRADIFDQVVESESLGESTTASSTWTDKITQAYTPNQAEDVLVLTNHMMTATDTTSAGATRIENSTDSIVYADTLSHTVNSSSNPDYYTNLSAASLNVSSAKTFKAAFRRTTGSATIKVKDMRMIVWSMTLKTKPTALSVANVQSDSQTATTSTTYVDTDTTIAASSLPAGKYLVIWGGWVYSASNNEVAMGRLVRGTTEIGERGAETNGFGSMGGYWLGDLDGTEALKLQLKTLNASFEARMKGKFIKAIRLDQSLADESDYFSSGPQESSADELTNVATGSWTTVRDFTRTFHPSTSQDYILLSYMEISPDSEINDCQAQIVVDGTSMILQSQEGEDAQDIYGYVTADLVTIGAGEKTISLQGQSVDGATCDYRRSRIMAFRANVFDQVVENESLAENSVSTTGVWTDKTSITYTPNQSEQVLILANHLARADGTATPVSIGIYNSTDATRYGYDMPHSINRASGVDIGTAMTAANDTISATKTFKGQFQRQGGTTTAYSKEYRLIAWSMTLKASRLNQGSHRWFAGPDSGTIGHTYLQEVSDVSDAWDYTYTAQNFGAADANRLVVVAIGSRGAATALTSATIGGVAATIVAQSSYATNFSAIAYARVPTGSSGDVVLNYNSGQARSSIALYRLVGEGTIDVYDQATSAESGSLVAVESVAGGSVIAASTLWAGADDCDWSDVVEDYDVVVESTVGFSGASTVTSLARTVEAAPTWPSQMGPPANVAVAFSLPAETDLTPLATQNTASTIAIDAPLRLRQYLEQTQATTTLGGALFKLQYAEKSGTCDTGFSGESYNDLTASGSALSYYDDARVGHGVATVLVPASDPTTSSTALAQHYTEANSFNSSVAPIATGYAGLWDFSLIARTGASGKSYCLRTVNSTGSTLYSYSNIAEIYVSPEGPTLEQQLRGGQAIIDGVESPLVW